MKLSDQKSLFIIIIIIIIVIIISVIIIIYHNFLSIISNCDVTVK